ncbi:hypothetical protein AB0K21_35505 [Streptosporangium sp. NPDC049248]|uniref:hypothetical protein n=1 Tax=Streptosporangium sp. NPDC049248 TaxID=3155651 RepID=UPI003445FC29
MVAPDVVDAILWKQVDAMRESRRAMSDLASVALNPDSTPRNTLRPKVMYPEFEGVL